MRYFNAQGIHASGDASKRYMPATIRSGAMPESMPADMETKAVNVRRLYETLMPHLPQIDTVQVGNYTMAWTQCKAQLGLFK